MNDFETKLRILYDITVNKKVALEQILNITENQRCIIELRNCTIMERSNFFRELTIEKQVVIDKVVDQDRAFDSLYKDIQDCFYDRALVAQNKDLIKLFQDEIALVCELDEKIRLVENSNSVNLKISAKNTRQVPFKNSNLVIESYKKFNK